MYPSHCVSGSNCTQRPVVEPVFHDVRTSAPAMHPVEGLPAVLLKYRAIRLPLEYIPESPSGLRNCQVPDPEMFPVAAQKPKNLPRRRSVAVNRSLLAKAIDPPAGLTHCATRSAELRTGWVATPIW